MNQSCGPRVPRTAGYVIGVSRFDISGRLQCCAAAKSANIDICEYFLGASKSLFFQGEAADHVRLF